MGPGRVQVSALNFGVASSGVCMGLNFSEDLFFFGPHRFWAKNRTNFQWKLFFGLHLILGKKLD